MIYLRKELERLKEISINENPTDWQRLNKKAVKVASLNCAGLKPHFLDIQADKHLMKADIIHLIETSLDVDEENLLELAGYQPHFLNIGKGKGIATYYKTGVVKHEQDLKENNMQITKFTCHDLDIINLYRSSNGHSVELLNHLLKMITKGKPTLITGDFNICYSVNKNNRLSQGLEKNGFSQLVKQATHIRGGHIDHAYWRDQEQTWEEPQINRYSPSTLIMTDYA